jgi:hypothetical protein
MSLSELFAAYYAAHVDAEVPDDLLAVFAEVLEEATGASG